MTNETPTTNPVKTTKPRRWFRFRLRTLLIMVTLLSVSLVWVGWELDQRRREKVTIAWIEEMGGYVSFDSSFPNNVRNWWKETTDNWFGERVQAVRLGFTKESDLSPLAELKNLKILIHSPSQMSDLSPLADLKNLEHLDLGGTQVSDLSPLAELKNLNQLALSGTQVSDLSPLAELKNVKTLWLWSTEVNDLSPLAKLKNLEKLFLTDTLVSDEQVEELRLEIPNCDIEFEFGSFD